MRKVSISVVAFVFFLTIGLSAYAETYVVSPKTKKIPDVKLGVIYENHEYTNLKFVDCFFVPEETGEYFFHMHSTSRWDTLTMMRGLIVVRIDPSGRKEEVFNEEYDCGRGNDTRNDIFCSVALEQGYQYELFFHNHGVGKNTCELQYYQFSICNTSTHCSSMATTNMTFCETCNPLMSQSN